MAMVTSQAGSEALQITLRGFQWNPYSGPELVIDYALLNPQEPDSAFDLGTVCAGSNFRRSLRNFNFNQKWFRYSHNFDWENDSDNASMRFKKRVKLDSIEIEFVFLCTLSWERRIANADNQRREDESMTHHILATVERLRAAQLRFPSLSFAISTRSPQMRNGILITSDSVNPDVRQILATTQSRFIIVKRRTQLTVGWADFVGFREALLAEIKEAEDKRGSETKAKSPPVPAVEAPKPPPFEWPATDRYQDHGDGTVTDVETGLQWMRFSLGQEWKDDTCVGEAQICGWEEALEAAEVLNRQGGYADHNDWRVPTIQELQTLLYCSSGLPKTWNDTGEKCQGHFERPTIYQPMFPNTSLRWYWSSSEHPTGADWAWAVSFYYGENGSIYKGTHVARLVRGGQ